MQRDHSRRAFTVVELVIVIAVIAVLAAVLIPTFGNVINKAKDNRALQEAKNAHTQYFIDHATEGEIAEYMFYDADDRWVALHNGAPVGVFESALAAITAMGLDPEVGFIDVDDRLYILTDDINNDIGYAPDEPTEPVEPDPPAVEGKTHTVKTDLANATLLGDSTVPAGASYTATLIWDDGYVAQVVKVVMDGKDITTSAYENNVITIPKVTGNIHIATAGQAIVWHTGAIDIETGSFIDAQNAPYRIYSDLIDVSLGATISIANPESGAEYCPVFYMADKTTLMYAPDNFVPESLTLFPGQYKYMRLMVRGEGSEPLTPEFGENIRIAVGTTNTTWAQGSINAETGEHVTITSKDIMDQRIRSGFFDLRHGLVFINSSSPYFNVSYYDENMNILSAYSGYKTSWNSKAYSQAVYVRIVVKATSTDAGQSISVTFTPS